MSLLIFAGFLLLGAWTYRLATNILGHLQDIPGPFINRLTNLPLKIQTLKGRRIYYVNSLHEKYGNTVRISPTEVAFTDLLSTREIHRIGSGYLKSRWYADFTGESDESLISPGLFAVIDPAAHAARRRLFARAFSYSSLVDWEPLLQYRTKLAISRIKEDTQRGEGKADMLKWWTFFATDMIAELAFGESFHTLENREKSAYSRDLEKIFLFSGLQVELSPLTSVLKHLPIPSIQHWLKAKQRLVSYGTVAINKHRALSDRGEIHGTLFSKAATEDKSGIKLADADIEREASNLIVAGSDTTAITLTYLIWALLRPCHRHLKKRLQDEINSLPEDFTSIQAKELPFLSAVIQESLRLFGAAPGSLPRVVPQDGRTLNGYPLPGGTVVSTAAYTLHRNANIFRDPLKFDPERWFAPSQDMKDAFMPFGGGSRICIGLHLAYMELSLATAMFFRTFPSARTLASEEEMEFENYFVIAPRSHKCEIIIDRVLLDV
ncbi:cytochrome P450 [Phlyctema vagabunda]|uniref:Cytochrome P450 n=1 Tax=Phlyctema vagabunda TaxID=108571 RepID=A0ABR4P8F1_9HELO